MKLSKREVRMFERLGLEVELESLYDARGQRPCYWKGEAKDRGCELVISDPCKYGHRFRTRTNSCIECNPSSLNYLRRYDQNGYVYGAWSAAGGLVKIGCTINLNKRRTVLRSQGYNGYSDWEYMFSAKFENMARMEKSVLTALKSSPSSEYGKHRLPLERETVVIRPSVAWWHFSRIASKEGGVEKRKYADLLCLNNTYKSDKSNVDANLRIEAYISPGEDIDWVNAKSWCSLNEVFLRSAGRRGVIVETDNGWEVIELWELLWCERSGKLLKGKHSVHSTKDDALISDLLSHMIIDD